MCLVLCTLLLSAPPAPPDALWIPGGTFVMGASSPDARADEHPPHQVRVDGLFMSAHEITNRQFDRFVQETGYRTTAERPVDWALLQKQVPPGTPKPDAELLKAGSMVFVHPGPDTSPRDIAARWQWVTGASWHHPEGPDSTLEHRWTHPVVHVSHDDALAYAAWRGGNLPTEAQWEYAARGGLHGAPFTWGTAAVEPTHANIWQGIFPTRNDAVDGHAGTAPVGTYAPNGYGLYDMAGNVWEWTADRYRHDAYALRTAGTDSAALHNPKGPTTSSDPRNPHAKDVRVHRGGSFLCHASYCSSYRPAARMATTPDSSLSHLGFRVVFTPKQATALHGAHSIAGEVDAPQEDVRDPSNSS